MAKETKEEYIRRVTEAGGNARKAQNPDYSAMGKKGMKKRWKKKKSKLKELLFD